MDYSYNYSYLREFVQEHNLKRKDITDALGSRDYISVNKWLEGKNPIHITAMLKLCNFYNIPLCNFFVDGDGMPCDFEPRLPNDGDQLLPTNCNNTEEGTGRGKGIIETRISTRTIKTPEQAFAVAEGLKRQAEQRNRRDAALALLVNERDQTAADSYGYEQKTYRNDTAAARILDIQNEHNKEIRQLEQKYRDKEDAIRQRYDDERSRLIEIIDRQAKEIARLSSPMHNMKAYSQGDNSTINIAAEGDIASR